MAEVERRDAAFRRYSDRISAICAWLSAILGLIALSVILAGYRGSLQMPNASQIHADSRLSEGLVAIIGAFWAGTIVSLFALFLVTIAVIHSKRRLRTVFFALPAVLYFTIVITRPDWLMAALRYGL